MKPQPITGGKLRPILIPDLRNRSRWLRRRLGVNWP